MKIINARSGTLNIDRFEALKGQAWCIVGANSSGMEEFFNLVTGEDKTIKTDHLELEDSGIISFKKQQELYEAELRKDDTDSMDKIDPGTLAKDFLQDIENYTDLIDALNMAPCLDKGYRQLSTGQSRKLMLLSQITKGKSCLIIQSPYEGLDAGSRKELDKALDHLHRQNILLIFFVNNIGDMPFFSTHAGVMRKGCLAVQGLVKDVLHAVENDLYKESPDFKALVADLHEKPMPSGNKNQTELVFLNKGFAGYRGQNIFQDLTLTIRQGDHTIVSGPNGCGKSTLLQMITGDHPACYLNDLRIFGIKRGTGESIWELKKSMGIVSADLHRNYYVPGTTLHCILSGLFDSIGLYQPFTRQQEVLALEWLARLGMTKDAETPFRDLGYASQRLVLIARALIKLPKLLILDEPTQGMDELNRNAVLDFLEELAREKISTLLYVSHREDEYRSFFTHHIKMG